MKISKHLTIILITLILILSCSKSKNWVANIEGDKISLNDFNLRFDLFLKTRYGQNPEIIPQARNNMEVRKAVLREMIHEKLVLQEAKKLNLHKNEEVKNLIKIYTEQIIINKYLENYVDLGSLQNVSQAEINEYYSKNKNRLRGIDPDKATMLIRREIVFQKYEQKVSEIIDKLKNKYRVTENEEAIRPIFSSSTTTNMMQGMEGQTSPQLPGGPGGTTPPSSLSRPKISPATPGGTINPQQTESK